MLKQALEIFQQAYEQHGDKLILDSYIPSDGTYIIVREQEGEFVAQEPIEIKYDKKQGFDRSIYKLDFICLADYNSKLLDMNKPIDGKKIIHSNNYLSFWVKKDNLTNGKLTVDIIDGYYNTLLTGAGKSPKEKQLAQKAEELCGEINSALLEKIRSWVKNNIFSLNYSSGKDYIKIFFEYQELYEQEGQRYFIRKIYNSSESVQNFGDTILGLPNDNVGLNAKKPYLENKTRKLAEPYLIDQQEVMLQKKFFDYLMNYATAGSTNVYLGDECLFLTNDKMPEKNFRGLFLRIRKGKEVEIIDCDVISNYAPSLDENERFVKKNILDGEDIDDDVLYSRKALHDAINEVLFSKFLATNYFSEPKDMRFKDDILAKSILASRDMLFRVFYKGDSLGKLWPLLDRISLDLIINTFNKNSPKKAKEQFNFRVSLQDYYKKGARSMADVIYEVKAKLKEKINAKETGSIESEQEYFFAVGQAVSFLLSKSKAKKKPLSLANPFINARNVSSLKELLLRLYKKYSHDLESTRFRNLYALIVSYEPSQERIDVDAILAGILHSNLIYEKKEKNEAEADKP